MGKLSFASDYMEGALPEILARLEENNYEKMGGYGTDTISAAAKEKIKKACEAPGADVWFLVGGTQTNAVVLTSLLAPYQAVIAATSGHISEHEAGAIEFAGHKVLALPAEDGKLSVESIRAVAKAYADDENREHGVMPGVVYLSQPTEFGTLYSLSELTAIRECCDTYGMALYIDGARLACALASRANDVTLPDLARLCDAFYIGGTKCGALFGEAVVFPKHDRVPHFFSIMKQRGALLAKGWLTGIQFDTLFTDGLYEKAGHAAVASADRIRSALVEKGYALAGSSPTNQVFVCLDDAVYERIKVQLEVLFWGKPDEHTSVIRIVTSWATTEEDVDALLALF